MSRRNVPPARTAQNAQGLKSLMRLESNKVCADCKKNKHPRWASWNLGIFVCIRCSGIHRGMGTHISRVKSVDLDSWTDEQLQSMVKWGNTRANKYWEAKLAPGHVPSEAKIENFIRTKYESKRWVMDGGIPDPSTLDADDDDVPLSIVQEKAKLERSASQRTAPSTSAALPAPAAAQNVDFFGDDSISAPPRPSTTGPPISRAPPPKAEPAPPKVTKPGDSLLGLDFFGGTQSAPPRPASTTPASTASAPSRPDLKQSILSLYASAPKPAVQPQTQSAHGRSGSFGLQNPGMPQQQPTSLGGLNDAFSGLSFTSSPPIQQQQKPSPFADLTSTSAKPSLQGNTSSAFGSGGNFFDMAPKQQSPPPQPTQQPQRTFSTSSGFGDFTSMTAPATAEPAKPAPASSGMGDLFDLSMPATQPSAPPKPAMTSPPLTNSAFNLSSRPSISQSTPAQPSPKPASTSFPAYSAAIPSIDAWGSNDAWASNTGTSTTATPKVQMASPQPSSSAWGAPAPTKPSVPPQISSDEDFGGWSSAPAQTHSSAAAPKPLGGMGGDDLFSNVWE